MSLLAIHVPRIRRGHDPIDTLADFHDALRDVAAWCSGVVDDDGTGSARDARWLRSFLSGPLVWHQQDEDNLLAPALQRKQETRWLDACVERMHAQHEGVEDAAIHLAALLEPVAMGSPVDPDRVRAACSTFQRAVAVSLAFENDIILEAGRVLLAEPDLDALTELMVDADGARAWPLVAIAGDVAMIHRVHAVRTRTATGLDIVRSYARCPRRRTPSTAECAHCAHLGVRHIDTNTGTGSVTCAVDDTPAAIDATVGDIMTRDVQCVQPDTRLGEAARMLADNAITGMPVVDGGGRPIGVLSQSDVVGAIASGVAIDEAVVGDVMMPVVFVIRERETLATAARLLLAEEVHRLPVINDDKNVVGIVTALDLLRALPVHSRNDLGTRRALRIHQ